MAGERGTVLKAERTAAGVDVVVDTTGGETGDVTAEHYTPPGVDSLPLPGDEVVVEEADGQGEATASKYQHDPQGKAAPGEFRVYARKAGGELVCEIWMKADGTIAVKGDGPLDYNDGAFVVDKDGNAQFKGEVTAMAGTPAAVTLSQHLHPTAMGPSGPPQPGT